VKLTVVVPSYLPGFRYGGPIQSVHGMASALVRRGHDVRVVTTDCDQGVRLDLERRPIEIDGVTVEHCRWLGPARLRYAPDFAATLRAWMLDSDLVWINGLFELCSSRAMRLARRAGVPYVVSPRGMLDAEMLERRGRLRKRLWLDLLDARSLLDASALHLTARREQDLLPDLGGPLPPILTVANGVEHVPFAQDFGRVDPAVARALEAPGSKLVFLGRLSWKKGFDRLLPALTRVQNDVRLIIAGPDDGARGAIERDVSALGLGSRVHLVGPVTGQTRSALLEHGDALVLPSHSENFGNVVLEAMAAGTPAITTPEVGASEVVARTGAGVVSGGEPARLAEVIDELLSDPARLAEQGRRARAAAVEFGWDRLAERFEAGLSELLPRRSLVALPRTEERVSA
jgi:glycosyltransferase involved in cell wall biosynthesis